MVETDLGKITSKIFDGKHGGCSEEKNSGYYFISAKDLINGKIDYINAKQISKKDFDEIYSRTSLSVGDTIYVNSGDTIGKSIYYCDKKHEMVTSFQKSVAIIKPNDEVDSRFLYYLLKNETPKLRKLSNGSAQKNLLLKTLRNYNVKIFQKDYQKRVSNLLGNIDDLIMNNNEIITCIKDVLNKYFEYYFVQFSGENLTYSDELKIEIPENWEIRKLSDFIDKIDNKFDEEKEEKVIDLSIMNTDSLILSDYNNSSIFTSKMNYTKKGDILFGSIRPYLKKCVVSPFDCALASSVYDFRIKNKEDFNFILSLMSSNVFFDYVNKMSKGTRMPVVSSNDILNFKFAYNSKLAEDMNFINFQNIIISKLQQNDELKKLQEFLLPILMNGEVIINE